MHDLGFKKRKKVALNYISLPPLLPPPPPFVALWHIALSGSDSILILKWIPFFHVCGYSSRSLCCKYQKVILLNHLSSCCFFIQSGRGNGKITSWHCLEKQRANLLAIFRVSFVWIEAFFLLILGIVAVCLLLWQFVLVLPFNPNIWRAVSLN